MPKISATLEETSRQAALPKGVYNGHVRTEENAVSNKTGAPMIALTFALDGDTNTSEGVIESHDRVVPSHGRKYYIMTGGRRADGTPHTMSNLFDTINALGAEWKCAECDRVSTARFVQEKIKSRYIYLCPACGKPARLADHEQSWQGLPCRIAVDVSKMQDSDEEVNEVRRLYPIE